MAIRDLVFGIIIFLALFSLGLFVLPPSINFNNGNINKIVSELNQTGAALQEKISRVQYSSSGIQQLLDWFGLGVQASWEATLLFLKTPIWLVTILTETFNAVRIPAVISGILSAMIFIGAVLVVGFVIVSAIMKGRV